MKKLIAGNWKMNGTLASARTLAQSVAEAIDKNRNILEHAEFLVCPPFVHLHTVKQVFDHMRAPVSLGGQDCALQDDGAYTGDVSAAMLRDAGCSHVILGHSERRKWHTETDDIIQKKGISALKKQLKIIICVGETDEQRSDGSQFDVVGAQLAGSLFSGVSSNGAAADNILIAYEPVWAIGTGKVATPADIGAMHGFIRGKLKEILEDSAGMRILYGGSVKPDNAADIFAVSGVDGMLVGGASLKAQDYIAIAAAA